ncbi:MAG TPA: SgcJ/EcaC family oxidoreductase [Thermoanaerobaculia bacterium]
MPASEEWDREIDELFAAWTEAGKRGDAAALVSLTTEDAEFWTHGAPAVKGRQAVTAMLEGFFAGFRFEQSFEALERIVLDGWAFVRGIEHNRVTPKGGETVEIRQRAFMVLRREEDGRWRFARGMTNLEARPANPR